MLQHHSATPLYAQVKESLVQQIASGEIQPDEKLPSERELCEIYKVSRLTIRQAMNDLKNEGMIYTAQGKGTYAGRLSKVKHGLSNIVGFNKSLLARGLKPKTKTLYTRLQTNPHAASFFRVPVETQLFNTGIVGFGNDEPMVFYDTYCLTEVGEKVSEIAAKVSGEEEAYTTHELYEAAGIHLEKAVQTLSAMTADGNLAQILSVAPGMAVLKLSSEVYQSGGEPLEFKNAYYKADQYSFHIVRNYV